LGFAYKFFIMNTFAHLRKSLTIIFVFMLNFSYSIAQNNTNNIDNVDGSTNVFRVQEALGSDATYFTVKHHMDSLVENGFINDTLEDGPAAKFSRWDWFWNGRTVNPDNPATMGKFSNYLALMQQHSVSTCNTNPTPIQYNWNLLGPVYHPEQRMGRIDVVKTLPNNPSSKVLFAGAPTGGLWRTNDYTIPNPVWENITDNIGLPFIGVSGLEFDPTDNNTAYIIASYKQWTNYSIGVFKTTNLLSSQPTWTKILGGTGVSLEFQIIKILTHPTNANELYVLRDNELLQSTDGGNSFVSLATLPTLTQLGLNAKTHNAFDFILDKIDPSIIYITSFIVNTYSPLDIDGKLWQLNISNPVLTNINTNLLIAPKSWMKLDNGQSGTYLLYADQIIPNPANPENPTFTHTISKTINSGISWQTMSSLRTGLTTFLSIFEVSDENDNIIYVEKGRVVSKSLNGGVDFKDQHGYNNGNNNTGIFTHSDVRGFHMLNPSNDGMNDEFFVGNDGGILYSNSSNNQPGLAHLVNLENKNGTGLAVTQFFNIGQTQINDDIYAGGAQDNGIYVNRFNNWNITIVGDGYGAFFMKNTPNIAFYMGGSNGQLARYHRNTTALTPVWGFQISLPNNVFSCGVSLLDQPLIEVNEILYTSFHDVYKSTDQGITWTNLSNFTTTNGSFNIPHKFVIEGLAVGHQDQNIIYAAFREPTWNRNLSPLQNVCNSPGSLPDTTCPLINNVHICPLEKKFFKTTDGGATWTDISQNFAGGNNAGLAIRWFGITDLAISTTDDNKVWAAFDGIGDVNSLCNGVERVNITTDGGQTWTDYSNGLPYLPINDIEYYEGTNDGLFAATDIGMYYTDADLYPIHGWIKISDGLPTSFITDIDVNLCRGKIRIGTFGRGIWEADLQPSFAGGSLDITTSTTWMTSRDVVTNVVIKPGATLTINTGAVINVAKGKKIIIEQGGRLIVNGAKITNLCEEMWGGIEVRGDMNASQLTPGAQGVLDILNWAVIENARFAVHTSEHDANNNFIWGTFGGIVRVRDSFFKNNYHSIDFGPYQNFIPTNNQPIADRSFIRNTEFTWDDNGNMIALGVLPISHIGMWDSHGINLTGNEFRNDASSLTYSPLERGTGILAFDAEFNLNQRCVSTTFPCTAFDKPQFISLTYGIKAENTNAFNSIVVKNSDFSDCLRSIYLKNMDFAEVVNSTFYVASEFLGNPSYGLYLDNCNGYEVEENIFANITGNPTYGIYTKASGSTANEIYNNSLNNLQIANQTEGVNGLNTQTSFNGLIFRCNQNAGITDADIAVTIGVVNKNQGSCGTALSPANNLFSGAANDIWLSSSMPFMDYFYSSGNAQLVPATNFPPSAVITQNCGGNPFNPSVNCPSRQTVVNNPTGLLANISVLRTQQQGLTGVLDNGNTRTLINLINSTAPDWQIKNELMAASPYLSEEVLVAMLLKSPALPDWVVQQVLYANTPLTDKVFITMLQRIPALPDHIIHHLAIESTPLSAAEQIALIKREPALPDWVITPVMTENSPLFDEVLIALMERTPKLAHWSIRNIFVRNTPLSNEVIDVMDDQNYPNWLMNNINNSPFVAGDAIEKPQPLSPLLEQYNAISAVNHEIQLTENELFRTYLHDTTGTYGLIDVINYLKQQGGSDSTEAAKKLSCAFIKNSEFQDAQRTIDSLRTDTNLTAFCDFHTALNDLEQATPSTIDSITNTAIKQTVESVANSTNAGRERAGAEVLLEFSGIRIFSETFEPLNANLRTKSSDGKPAPGTIVLIGKNVYDEYFKIYPNPNTGIFYVEYKIQETNQAYFIFTDISGKELWKKSFNGKKGVLTIKEDIQPGIYLYQIVINNTVFDSNKIVITQ